MIAIADLEQTPEYKSTLRGVKFGERGYYKHIIPIVISEFGDQQFTRSHVEAVLLQGIDKVLSDNEMDRLSDGVKQRLFIMEQEGEIEKTGEQALSRREYYRRKV